MIFLVMVKVVSLFHENNLYWNLIGMVFKCFELLSDSIQFDQYFSLKIQLPACSLSELISLVLWMGNCLRKLLLMNEWISWSPRKSVTFLFVDVVNVANIFIKHAVCKLYMFTIFFRCFCFFFVNLENPIE